MIAKLLQPGFTYHGTKTHDTSAAFAKRMKQRQREADAVRNADAVEREQKVRAIAPSRKTAAK